MKIKFITLGCKVNINETQKLIDEALQFGFDVVYDREDADIIVINSCTVTSSSDKKTKNLAKKAKETGAFTVLIGCYVDNNGKDNIADLMLNNKEKANTMEILSKKYSLKRGIDIEDIGSKTRAFIKIQDGCNRFCSFCIIPYARGRSKSLDEEEIINDVLVNLERGYKEFVLTGIHISSYGLDTKSSLLEIIQKVSKIEGIKRIRLGSLEPTIITEDFASELSKIEQICPHFHLSLQSGSDRVLKDMKRRYTSDEYYNSVQVLRKYFDKPAITTDIIVGYPTERADTFEETIEFVKKVKFSAVHIFTYSHRVGTTASKLMDLSHKTKRQRYNALKEVCDIHAKEYISSFVGEEVEVLYEQNKGMTRRYINVIKTDKDLRNDIKKCVVKEIFNDTLIV